MITILKNFRAVVYAIIALFLYLFGYRQATQNQKAEVLNNVEKAKKSRNSLNNPERIKQLHDKYKR